MGRGRSRKPRNYATFRLCPRPGAADASDRVFVRVDANAYSVPGFADDDHIAAGPSPAAAAEGEEDTPSSSSSDGAPLPEHVRREILDLGLPDDGYDYLPHLRELRPSLSSTGGGCGSSSAAFIPRRRAHFAPPLDVKAYDASQAPIGSGDVAVTQVEDAIDLDVAKLLEESDADEAENGSEHEDLEEDFVLVASNPEEEDQGDEEENDIVVIHDAEDSKLGDGGGKGRIQYLLDEQLDLLAMEEYTDSDDDGAVTKGLCGTQKTQKVVAVTGSSSVRLL